MFTRIAVFIDGSNLYHTQKSNLYWKIDLKKLQKYLVGRFSDENKNAKIVEAIYYTGKRFSHNSKLSTENSLELESSPPAEELREELPDTNALSLFEKQERFIRTVINCGYSIVRKDVKLIRSEEGPLLKSNFDVEIAVDMTRKISDYDVAVLVSGDGDFTYLVDKLITLGKKVYVISHPQRIAQELREAVGMNFIDISHIKSQVEL